MFDFLTNNVAEIITLLISISGSFMSIPIALKSINKAINRPNKTQIELKNAEKSSTELTVGHDLKSIISYATDKKDTPQQDKNTSSMMSPKPPKFDYNILYSSRADTLNELYEKRNLDKSLKKISFTLAVIMTIIGTIILFTGIIICLFTHKEIGWITTSSGAIIEVVASIYFWLVNRTMKEVKDNSKQLEKTEALFTAIELVEKISDNSIKDETYKGIIDNLMNQEKISK